MWIRQGEKPKEAEEVFAGTLFSNEQKRALRSF